MTAALYYVGEELENLMRTKNREQRTDRQTEKAITEVTLIVDGSSG